ncbi:hypothetical protein, partial [Amphibiibacter pelophylacis]
PPSVMLSPPHSTEVIMKARSGWVWLALMALLALPQLAFAQERPPPVGASGKPILTLYGQDTREVYRCSAAQRGAGALFTDVDCPPDLPQRVAVRLWLNRVGGSPPQAQFGPVRPEQRQGTESRLVLQP